jgi:hypothetical protein
MHDNDQVPDGEDGAAGDCKLDSTILIRYPHPNPNNGVRLSGLTWGKLSWECPACSGRLIEVCKYDMLSSAGELSVLRQCS